MIIKDTLQNMLVDGDDMVFNHAAYVGQELSNAHDFRKNNDGNWSDDRDMRLIGSIPELVYHKLAKEKPEIVKDAKLLKKWLYETEEGKLWTTNTALDTGKSSQCIVK
jgi:hypothetical protein